MLWKLILVLTLCYDTLEATNNDGEKSPRGYGYNKWKSDVWLLTAVNPYNSASNKATLKKLERMVWKEHRPQFPVLLRDIYSNKRGKSIKKYLVSFIEIASETTLLRKSKTTSQNLFDIISKHYGCTREETLKIESVFEIFGTNNRLSMVFENLKSINLNNCWNSYKDLLMMREKLIGQLTWKTVEDLSHFIGNALNENESSEYTIDDIARGVGTYLISLDHPVVEDIMLSNSIEMEQIFEVEVYNPLREFCGLLNPVRKAIAYKNLNIRTHITKHEELIDFSCSLASFAPSSIGSKILDNLLDRVAQIV